MLDTKYSLYQVVVIQPANFYTYLYQDRYVHFVVYFLKKTCLKAMNVQNYWILNIYIEYTKFIEYQNVVTNFNYL